MGLTPVIQPLQSSVPTSAINQVDMIHISRLSNSEPNFNEKNTVKQDWIVEVMGDHLALGQLLDFSLTSFQDTNDTLEICPHTCQALL